MTGHGVLPLVLLAFASEPPAAGEEPSRWSNRGAMVPIVSPVPVTAELPERAVPIETPVETPGQALSGGAGEERISARLSLSGYHLETSGLGRVLGPTPRDTPAPPNDSRYATNNWEIPTVQDGASRDIDLLRARATLGYEHIAGTELSLHLDVEYRPQISGSRFTDYRLNEAYASYGLDEQRTQEAPWWGVALGRLAVREAGYAQADGIAARFRIAGGLQAGIFGGVTGNPYGYNWNQRRTEVFSADWYTGGAFVSLQLPELSVNLAGVVIYAKIAEGLSDVDRAYVYLDGAWLILPELNLVVNGWLDVLPGGQVVQNLSGSFSWSPFDDLSLALGGGRFSTLLYAVSSGYTFTAAGDNAVVVGGNQRTIVDPDGQPVVPFDAALMTSIYSTAWLRGAYRILRELELGVRLDVLIRDVVPGAPRVVPGVTVRYGNPEIIDAHVDLAYIADPESQAKAVISGGLGRGLFGFYLSGDLRYLPGDIDAFDAGTTLGYTFPRGWFPGTLSVHGMFRYFRENVALYLQEPDLASIVYELQPDGEIRGWETIEKQETLIAFAGIEWRL